MYKEIEVKVEPHTGSCNYYQILWREKKKFNLFNKWKRIVSVWDGAYLTYDQPVMFDRFNDAVDYAKELKANPELIAEHYTREDKKYKEANEYRIQENIKRNKSIII